MVSPVVELWKHSGSIVHPIGDSAADAPAVAVADLADTSSGPSEAGRRVAVRRANDLGYLHEFVDAARSGRIIVSVNTKFSDAEADDLIARSGADDPAAAPFAAPGVDDPYVVFTTSGTTGPPKMVLHTQTSTVTHSRQAATRFGYTTDSVVLVVLPLCGTFGLTSLFTAIAGNSRVVLIERFDVALVADAIERFGVTHTNATDDMLHRLLEYGADLSSIRLAGYAAFNTSLADLVERGDRAGCTLTGLYGMSEVQALYSLRDPGAEPAVRAQAGGTLTSPDAAARVVDPETGTVTATGVEGELQLRGPSLLAGYLAEGGATIDTELTADNFDDGWFRTGDLATMQDERTFHYIARMGDSLRLGGFLVAPTEIESVVLEQPGITGCQVIAIDRPTGARPVAFVTGDPVDGERERTIIEACGRRLAKFKVPIAVVQIDAFPVTESANGTKIRKTELRRLATERLA